MNASIWVYISVGVAIGIGLVIVAMALAVIRALFNGTIDLKYLLSESASPVPQAMAQANNVPVAGDAVPVAGDPAPVAPPETPKASASRFQMVIFTFVIAGVYLVLCLESGTMLDIPQNVIWLLGVSGGTYAASKVIKTAGDSNTAGQ